MQVTVKQLRDMCNEEIAMGKGDRAIVISDDNEGNGFHGLFYGFSDVDADTSDSIYDTAEEDPKKLIILG